MFHVTLDVLGHVQGSTAVASFNERAVESNYCRIFMAKTKDAAAKKFEPFLGFFENMSTANFTFCA